MHNLAIALKLKGYHVSGSDDEIFEPSLSRLKKHGLLPNSIGWETSRITPALDAVVLGMHARADNPELLRAKEIGLKIYSYPEYLYEQTKNKTRVVIGGSHGKTTITAMVMHVLRHNGVEFDYMVGAQLDGFENMVGFSESTKLAIFEGDEYLTSPIDPRPKFHVYRPNIALVSGISWDHINVFPTFGEYRDQFAIFMDRIEPGGSLVYCAEDEVVMGIVREHKPDITTIPYTTHPYTVSNGKAYLSLNGQSIPLHIFGRHNMQNISGAKAVCSLIGVPDTAFYSAIAGFKGAAKRLQTLAENDSTKVFLDFAHSPSKVRATIQAAKEAFPDRQLVACFELHTFSSLNSKFLGQYNGTLVGADVPLVYFDPVTLHHKKLPEILPEQVQQEFGRPTPGVFTKSEELVAHLRSMDWANTNLLIMSSGNFSGVNLAELAKTIAPMVKPKVA